MERIARREARSAEAARPKNYRQLCGLVGFDGAADDVTENACREKHNDRINGGRNAHSLVVEDVGGDKNGESAIVNRDFHADGDGLFLWDLEEARNEKTDSDAHQIER